MFKDEIYHYGIKGMKWGVRRLKKKNGVETIKRGSTVKRVSYTIDDPTYDNKKYVSINPKDHKKWEKYLGEVNAQRNVATYNQTYIVNKDLKVMNSVKQGELYTKMLLDTKFKNQAIRDTEYTNKVLDLKKSNDYSENISRNIAAQTKTGKAFVDKVLKSGYDALVDTHGTNVSKIPVIVLNPDLNLSKTSKTEYTKATKDLLRTYYSRYY